MKNDDGKYVIVTKYRLNTIQYDLGAYDTENKIFTGV